MWEPQYVGPRGVAAVFNGHSHQLECTHPVVRMPLHGLNGGTGFSGPWTAAVLADTASGLSNIFFIESATPVQYAGYDAGPTALKTYAQGSFYVGSLMARRNIQPVASGTSIWFSFFYKKNTEYYAANQGGIRLEDSAQASRYLQAATAVRLLDGTNYGAFQVALGGATAVSPPIAPQGAGVVPADPFFVLAKFTFSGTQSWGGLKVFRSPEPITAVEPAVWDAAVRTNMGWTLTLDTMKLLGETLSRNSWIAQVRVGRALEDVLPPANGRAKRAAALIHEPFDIPPSRTGAIHWDAGGINYNAMPPGNRFTDFKQMDSYMPLVTLVRITPHIASIEARYYSNFGAHTNNEVLGMVTIVPEPCGALAFLIALVLRTRPRVPFSVGGN